MSERLDCVVIGAGIVGLAIARALALSGRHVIVVESEPHAGMHTSSRNSEVIHAGIYYPTNSLKAQLCLAGRVALYRYCADRSIPHKAIGKLIVATREADLVRLHSIEQLARANGVDDLYWLDEFEIQSLEPHIRGIRAIMSPSTGIVDSHALIVSLQADVEDNGGYVIFGNNVEKVDISGDGFNLTVDGQEASCATLVNSAGLNAQSVAASYAHTLNTPVPVRHMAKGHYYAYAGKSPFEHLIYPLPEPGGLGIHATNDLAGTARFGPDVVWIDEMDYSFDDTRKAMFLAAIRHYFPDVDPDRLSPAYTGIRPKIAGPGESAADFLIQGSRHHGVPGLINLFGIESPGLTASLAIGDYVQSMIASE